MKQPTGASAAALLQAAVDHHRAGRLDQAARGYRAVLDAQPRHFDATHMLGVIALQTGRPAEGRVLIEAAVAMRPDAAAAWLNLGFACRDAGDPAAALAAFERLLRMQPRHVDAVMGRADALARLGRPDAAAEAYAAALAIDPGRVEAWQNRGSALASLQRHDEALACFEQVLARAPAAPAALSNWCQAMLRLGRGDEAVALCAQRWAATADAAAAEAAARTLAARGRHAEALSWLQRIAPAARSASAWERVAAALLASGQPHDAEAAARAALARDAGHARAWATLGYALQAQRRADDAIGAFGRAVDAAPTSLAALRDLGMALNDAFRFEQAVAVFARAAALDDGATDVPGRLVHAKMNACDWSGLDALIAQVHAGVRAGRPVADPFGYQAYATAEADLLACARLFSATHHRAPDGVAPAVPRRARDDARVRVGYVAAEFRQHATALLMAGVFDAIDRSRFAVFGFDNGWDDGSALRQRIRGGLDELVDIATLSDAQAVDAIRARGIDVLVDLNGFFGRARGGVFAARAAPVQVNYLGFPGTLGTRFMDYLVADREVIPAASRAHYEEAVVWLPDSYQANDARRPIAADPPSRAQAGLPADAVVFCCFNNPYKFTPEVFDDWMRILQAVPGSVLWLLDHAPETCRNLRAHAHAHGVDPARLVFAPPLPNDRHLARHALADLFLDTVPYNAHTTAADALWSGVPVLTRTGSTFPGRVATSLLKAADLSDLVVADRAAYVARATTLGRDPAALSALRQRWQERRRTCRLFDTGRFSGHLHAAFAEMHERAVRGLAPAPFAVGPDGTISATT